MVTNKDNASIWCHLHVRNILPFNNKTWVTFLNRPEDSKTWVVRHIIFQTANKSGKKRVLRRKE